MEQQERDPMIAVLDALEVICRRLTDQLLFNQDEAAGYLGIGETLFKQLVADGRIKKVQITDGGHYFYTRDDLEEFVNDLERQVTIRTKHLKTDSNRDSNVSALRRPKASRLGLASTHRSSK